MNKDKDESLLFRLVVKKAYIGKLIGTNNVDIYTGFKDKNGKRIFTNDSLYTVKNGYNYTYYVDYEEGTMVVKSFYTGKVINMLRNFLIDNKNTIVLSRYDECYREPLYLLLNE